MKVTVLGSSGTYAGPDEACSGYLVQSDGVSLLVDAGAGVLGELQRHIALDDLDAVVISHSHPDHWVEIPILYNALRYVICSGGVPLYSTAETLELAEGIRGKSLDPVFLTEQIVNGSEVAIGDLTVSCSRTDHPPETLGFCISDGEKQVAYSADSGPGWSFDEFAGAVDLALCEATFREGEGHGENRVHMTARDAGAMSRAAGVRRLAITHLLPGADRDGAQAEAADAFGGPVEVAARGVAFDI